jgi:hypothetical protein
MVPRATRIGALLAIVVASVLLALSGVAGSASSGNARWRSHSSARYGFSLALPPGWRMSPKRLVPKLISPLEIFSAGTFPMPVGGGGNCGRYPIAAIERMRSGDALVSVQEYAMTKEMRARTGGASAPPPLTHLRRELRRQPDQIGLREELHPPGERVPPDKALWSAKLSFTSHNRWFDALVFVRARPTPRRLSQLGSILAHLRFSPGSRVELPS